MILQNFWIKKETRFLPETWFLNCQKITCLILKKLLPFLDYKLNKASLLSLAFGIT